MSISFSRGTLEADDNHRGVCVLMAGLLHLQPAALHAAAPIRRTRSRMRSAKPARPLSWKVIGACRSRSMATRLGSMGAASSAATSAASFEATGSSTC